MTIQRLNLVWFLIYSLIASKPFGTYGFNIKLFPVDRIDKTLFPENPTLEERYQRISNTSRGRVRQLELSMVSPSSMEWKESIGHGPKALKPVITKHPIFRYYITSVRVGTSSYVANLIVDTNGDDTWIQCQGCTKCFPLRQGNFDRSKSQTYRPLPCEHPLCVPRMCKNGSCAYHVKYPTYVGTACYSEGQVGLDTFIFQDGHHNPTREFHQTAFGCGLNNEVKHWGRLGENNTVSGVLGLGAGSRSILTQYAHETKRRISYCLPTWSAHQGTHTLLNFGDDARIGGHPGSTVQTTALVYNVTRYTVNLTGISINGKRLDVHPRALLGGMRIDTGSPDTVFNKNVYNAVKVEITHYFLSKYSWLPKPFKPGRYDVCYAVPHGNYTYPTMTYHFPGADLILPPENVFRFYAGGFCMMIMHTSIGGETLLGSFQQTNHRFLFDFERLTASFVPEVCEAH